MDPVLFYSVFNFNQLDSPCHTIFRAKRNCLDKAHEEHIRVEEVICNKYKNNTGKKLKRRFELEQLKLKWYPSYREKYNKVLLYFDDLEEIETLLGMGTLGNYVDQTRHMELDLTNSPYKYIVDNPDFVGIEKYFSTSKDYEDLGMCGSDSDSDEEEEEFVPRDYTPEITLATFLINIDANQYLRHYLLPCLHRNCCPV